VVACTWRKRSGIDGMSDIEPNAPRGLRWWFWLVLFTPAALSPVVPRVVGIWAPSDPGRANAWILGVSLYVLLSIDGICCIAASMIYSRFRKGSVTGPQVVGAALSFFVLNLIIAYAGCMVVGMVESAVSR